MTMDCKEALGRLHPYLDRELDLQGALALERHLASCAACQAIFARQTALQSVVRAQANYHAAPAGLQDRVRARLAGATSPRNRWRLPSVREWLQLGVAAAAGAVISWTAAIQYAGVSADERLAEQVIDGYARSMVTARLVDVPSSDRHTVKPWLSSKLDFSPKVVDLADAGFPLAGGRLDYLDDRPVAVLVYRYRQHVIDLFVWPEQDGGATGEPKTVSRKGYNVVRWSEGGMALWAISDVDAGEMRKFAEAYAQAR
jgi:mycothiol system anti-sigma-R factor